MRTNYLKLFIAEKILNIINWHNQFKLKNPKYKNNIKLGDSLYIEDYFSFDCNSNNFELNIGSSVHFKKYCHILLFDNARLNIGSKVFFNNYCSINCLHKISIGENTMFGEGVKIYDHNHHNEFKDNNLIVSKFDFTTDPIIIGKNCWIGSNVTILKGVEIGDNVIIGANNLIYKSVAPNSIIKGNFSTSSFSNV